MESFVHEYISSTFDDDITEGLLEGTVPPFTSLQPSDLTTLLRLQSHLPSVVKSGFGHGDDCIETCQKNCSSLEEFESGHDASVGRYDEQTSNNKEPFHEVLCRGTDTNNSPVEYTVKGLCEHELPVIGICVDSGIIPGFNYNVRRIGSTGFLFDAPKTLLSVGMGYGKRLTFSSDNLNNNENYFWSDSDPSGYAFSIQAIFNGQKFSILDADSVMVGETVVDKMIEPQVEVSSTKENSTVVKRVIVNAMFSMKYYQRHNHGLVEMMTHEDSEIVSGVAVVRKSRSNRKASLVKIEDIYLERFGLCCFVPEV